MAISKRRRGKASPGRSRIGRRADSAPGSPPVPRAKPAPGSTSSKPPAGGVKAVVGLGASAGGLDALRRFLGAMPADSGMAFVLIQHLDPEHKSETASILGRCTTMPVTEAADRQAVEPNHVYVIPPNASLALRGQRLRLGRPIESRGTRMPVDFLFRSLAAEFQERSIGVVLSGTGSDGTLGLGAIKAAGGLAVAQDPRTAGHDGMPRSAIAGGVVDRVLPVEAIPDMLIKYVKHPYLRQADAPAPEKPTTRNYLEAILDLVRARTKFDFTGYKRGTLHRRIHRRMSLRHILRVETYRDLLRRNPQEADDLVGDLLISVTHFFREPEAWKVLQEQAVRPLVARKKGDGPIRVWAPGCATGEEVYSIVMLFLDEMASSGKHCGLQVFGSDANRKAFTAARLGVYPESLAADVSAQRLRRYFVREGEHYRIRGELRDAVVFAEHNVLTDPPFSRMDLISCRNLLIYLDPPSQERLMGLFHYALNDGGYLFLGSAESVGEPSGLFEPLSRKWRIYRRISTHRSDHVVFPPRPVQLSRRAVPVEPAPVPVPGARFTEMARQMILDRLAPACVVVDRGQKMIFTCGPTRDFLTQPAGMMQTNLPDWVQDPARAKLRAALHKAQAGGKTVKLPALRLRRGRTVRAVDVTVEPLKTPHQAQGLALVTFRDALAGPVPPTRPRSARADSLVAQLEDELQVTRDDLRTTINQLEGSNEELKASNEEVTSANEELQSTNEELETSKEELQSLNEELSTVNSQLQVKVEEFEAKNNDLNNLLSSTDIATLCLDRRFLVKWFTAPTTTLLRLLPTDVGRPIGDLAQKFTGGDLLEDARSVLHKLTPTERQVRGQDGRWYLRRILPYHTAEDKVEGVVATFVDIHRLKLAEEGVRRLATVVRDSNDAVTLQDFDGHVLDWNHGAEAMLGYPRAEALALNSLDLIPPPRQAEMRSLIEQIKRGGRTTGSIESQRITKDGRCIDVSLTATAVLDEDGKPIGIATTESDVTERNKAERALRQSQARTEAILDSVADSVISITPQGIIEAANQATTRLFGYAQEELLGRNVDMLMPEPHRDQHNGYLQHYLRTGERKIIGIGRELAGRRKDGTTFPIYLTVAEAGDGDQRSFIGTIRDITQHKQDQAAILEMTQNLEHRVAERTALAQEQAGRLRELAAQLLATEEQERRSLASDLHDNLSQVLHVAKMKLSSLGKVDGSEEQRQVFAEVQDLLGQANQAARSMTYQLSPPILHELGLGAALEWLGEDMERLYKLKVTVDMDGQESPLDERARIILFRAVRELLINVAKHAGVHQASVRIRRTRDQVIIEVEDHGVGFDPDLLHNPARRGKGFGLFSIRERLDYMGGSMVIRSTANKKTAIRLTMPVVMASDDPKENKP